jgi:mono/diheme cytochrome c family protein
MGSISSFAAGLVTAILLAFIIGVVFLRTAVSGFSANAQPTAFETWIARKARAMAVPDDMQRRTNPVPNSPDVLAEARAHWADHCAACHGNDGSGQSEMGKHLYPPAPDMRQQDTQQMTDGEIFYIIQNGIRLSGMPAWGAERSGEEDSWKLVRFIRRLPNLSPSELQEMEKLNPKSPHELEEEQEEQRFLNGQPSKPSTTDHHHH